MQHSNQLLFADNPTIVILVTKDNDCMLIQADFKEKKNSAFKINLGLFHQNVQ